MSHSKILYLLLVQSMMISLLHAALPELKINSQTMPSQLMTADGQTWEFKKNWLLNKPEESPSELSLAKGKWKKNAKYSYIVGYNGDITLKISISGSIEELQASGKITNYADSRQRQVYLSYSTDGVTYSSLAESDFKSGSRTVSARKVLDTPVKFLWVRFGRKIQNNDSNGKYGFIVFNQISLNLKGKHSSDAKSAGKSYAMKSYFPTGVFWPWERTKVNAEKAGMEFWQFVDAQMKQLYEHGCDTIWFVNLKPHLISKVLLAAEKNHIQALVNPDLISIFYHGAYDLAQLERLARRTAEKYGDFPALRGYVLKDEPELCSLETLDYFTRLMKKYDPKRDCTAVVMNRPTMTYLREGEMPVTCTDIYYFGHNRSQNIPNPSSVSQQAFSKGLEGYNTQAELHGKHHWFMGQIFSDYWGRHYVKDGKMIVYPKSYLHWRMPTPAETRWQIWESVRNGSKGVFFYVLFPPKQLEIAPEEVKADSPDMKIVTRMDRLAKMATQWPQQWLTEEKMEFEPYEGVVQYGGAPTPQMTAMGESFKILRRNEAVLVSKKRSKFPVFHSTENMTDTATFETGDAFRYGIVVNRNVNQKRTVTVLLPANIRSVKDLRNGQALTILPRDKNFKEIKLDLEAGDGTILQADFIDDLPGMCICRESFDQVTIHRVKLHGNSRIFHHGLYGVDARRSIRLKEDGDSSLPVFSVRNLTNFKSAQNTFALNLNNRQEHGTMYCQITGRLKSAVIKAVSDQASLSHETNVNHLALNHFQEGEKNNSGARKLVIQSSDFRIPAVIPVGTTSLEVYLTDEQDFIEDLNIWFIQKNK